MKRIVFFIAFFLVAVRSFGIMRCDTDTVKHAPIFDKIQIRQSFQDATEKESPAQFMLSLPSSGRSNWLVDAGLAARIAPWSGQHSSWKVMGEFHRNTLIDRAQYNWQTGLNYAYLNPRGPGKLSLSWTGNLKYVRDVIDTTHSVAYTLSWGLYQSGMHCLNFGRPAYLNDYKNTYQLDPSFQVQYQQYLSNDTHNGAIVRPLICLAASYAWNAERKKGLAPTKVFEIALNYTNRYAIVNNTGSGEGYSKSFRAGILYYFLNKKSSTVSLGMDYNIGSDPLVGLKDQNYLRFAFQVQI